MIWMLLSCRTAPLMDTGLEDTSPSLPVADIFVEQLGDASKHCVQSWQTHTAMVLR